MPHVGSDAGQNYRKDRLWLVLALRTSLTSLLLLTVKHFGSAYCRFGPVHCSALMYLFTLRPLSVHHSPFTTHRSPFTAHCLLLTARRSPFTVHRSPPTVHRSLFTVHRSLFTIYRSPLTVHWGLPYFNPTCHSPAVLWIRRTAGMEFAAHCEVLFCDASVSPNALHSLTDNSPFTAHRSLPYANQPTVPVNYSFTHY